MSVRIEGDAIIVEGPALVGDAEPILAALLDDPFRSVDIGGAAGLHSATLQLLLAIRPRITGTIADPFIAERVLPLLDTGEGQA